MDEEKKEVIQNEEGKVEETKTENNVENAKNTNANNQEGSKETEEGNGSEENSEQTTEKNENEGIQIAGDVIAVIAGVAVSEVSGVAGMAGGFAGGISEVFSGKKNLAKGIKVDKTDGKIKIDVNIIVEYGTRIPDVAFEIQNRVKKAVENMTGMKVEEINVHVQGVDTNIKKEEQETTTEETK